MIFMCVEKFYFLLAGGIASIELRCVTPFDVLFIIQHCETSPWTWFRVSCRA